jgi:hypothetical protein
MNRLLGHRYSHETISAMTEEVLQAVEAFRRRPLPEEMAFVYLDGLYLKLLREGEGVVREVVYVALGVTPSGERQVLGYWLLPAESALGWEGVLGELWQRGLRRVLLFITDGLPGLPEAIRRVYPQAEWQRCVVHGVRWSLGQVRARDRTLLAEDLRRVYGAESRGEALEALEALREAWGSRYPGVVALWAGDSGAFLRFYGYPKALWPYLRSTNLMERFIREIRRGTKVRDHKFPSEEAVYKLLYLGHGRQPVSWVGEARREVGGAAASRSEHLAAQGVLGGEGDAGEDASGAVCPPYTNAYTYILTRPVKLIPNGAFHPSCSLFAGRGRTLQELSMQLGWTRQRVRYHLQRLLAQGVVEETAPGVYQSRINLTLEDAKIVRRLCDSICRSLNPPPEGTLFLQLEPLSLDVVQSRLEWILRAVKSQLSGEELTSSSKYRIFLILVPTTKE